MGGSFSSTLGLLDLGKSGFAFRIMAINAQPLEKVILG
jgi:hypothetical protein